MVKSAVDAGEEEVAWRTFVSVAWMLESEADDALRVVLAYVAPAPVGPEWDAAIAGLVEWQLGQRGTPVPGWAREHVRDGEPWAPPAAPAVDGVVIANVPEALVRRGIVIDESELWID